jgi:kynurenine formamidase
VNAGMRDRPDSWGRWGDDDECGTTNLIVPATVLAALSAVRTGHVLRLDTPIVSGQGFGLVGRPDPVHLMFRDGGDYAAGLPERGGFGYSDDFLSLPTQSVTHMDALSHVWCDGLMYNGFPSTSVTSRGARRLGIDKLRPIVTRGVFVDAAGEGTRGPEDPVRLAELQQRVGDAGVTLKAGDALVVRTGWMPAARAGTADATAWGGLHSECGAWLAERDIAVVAADNPGVEVFPSGRPEIQVPMHIELIRGRGTVFLELLDLDGLAEALALTGRVEFLLVASALRLVGGVGSPVVPLAVL